MNARRLTAREVEALVLRGANLHLPEQDRSGGPTDLEPGANRCAVA
jgi:hypothetical protein